MYEQLKYPKSTLTCRQNDVEVMQWSEAELLDEWPLTKVPHHICTSSASPVTEIAGRETLLDRA
jgi:hypothetical protein